LSWIPNYCVIVVHCTKKNILSYIFKKGNLLKKYLLTLFLIFKIFSSFGQTDNYGTEFWAGFMSNLGSGSELRLFIAAKDTTSVTISVPLKGWSQKLTVFKDSVKIITIPNSVGQILNFDSVQNNGIHILSDYPVAVTAMNLRAATTDASLIFPLKNIPINALYTTGHPSKVANYAGNEFLVVSADSGALIEIIPTAATAGGKPAFTPFNITLNKGEVYLVTANKGNILDGSTVRCYNNKRIMVYTGDKCSAFPCGACDHQYEQVFSNQLLDTAYYVLPHFGHKNGYAVKAVSIDTSLIIKVNGKFFRIPSKDSAIVFDVPTGDSVLHLSADRKFSCFQFMKGPTCNGYITAGWGDPSILQVLSAKYMGQRSSFNAVNSTNLKDHFVSILIPTTAKNEVYMDGAKILASEFIPVVDNPDYSYAALKISLGVHTIKCDKGHLAYCYGIGSYESYLFTGGFSLPNFEINIKDSVIAFNCKNNEVIMKFDAKLDGAIKKYYWDFGDGTYDSVKTVQHAYKVGKEFTIKLWAVGYNNKVDSVIKKFTFKWPEFNPVFDKLLCDQSFTFEEKNPFFKNFKWQDNSTGNTYTSYATEKIWVSATDTSGYCKFSDTAQVSKVDVYSKISVDTLSNCHLNNLFHFKDSSFVKNDSILYKVWNFPGGVSLYDTSNFNFHFRKPGQYMVYLDIYPKNSVCKARFEIPINIHWNTDIDAFTDKTKYCHGEMATLTDNSYSCCQKVKKYYWIFDDSTKASSDSGKFKLKVSFDYKLENPIRNYLFVTETIKGCRDTIKSSLLVMPAALSNYDFGTDTVKCLALSRWNFTHTVDEHITGPYALLWDFGNGKTGTFSQYKNFRYTDTGIFKIKLKTTTDLGCTDSTIKTLRVANNGVASFNIKDSVQCLNGNGFTFIDNSNGYNLKYNWDFGNGKKSFVKDPGIITFPNSGKFKVKLKVVSSYPGCFEDSTTRSLTVLKNPIADFVFDKDTVCLSSNKVNVTSKSIVFNGKKQFYWNTDFAKDSTETPNTFYLQDTGNYRFQLAVIDSFNCSDTITKFMRVLPNPVVMFTINDSIQCFNGHLFKFSSLNTVPTDILQWRFGGLNTSNQTAFDLLNIGTPGKYWISLTVKTKDACTDSSFKQIEVLPKPIADFIIPKDTQCFDNHSLSINNSSKIVDDVITGYFYKEGQSLISTSENVSGHTFKVVGDHIITQVIKTKEGCSDSINKIFFLIENPKASFIADSVCIGEQITLTAKQLNGAYPINSWKWQSGDGNSFTGNPYDYTYLNKGTFHTILTFSDSKGCIGKTEGYNLIYPNPVSDFKITVVSSDQQFTKIKLTPVTYGYSSYLWTFPNGNNINKDSTTTFVSRFFKDRIYLKTMNGFGCTDTISKYLYIFPRLDKIYIENAFSPNNDQLNDVFRPGKIDGIETYTLSIFNRWGEKLFQTSDPNQGWDGNYLSSPAQAGVYIYSLEFIYADGNRYAIKGSVTLLR
jgi:gliding motility-associated-like protein